MEGQQIATVKYQIATYQGEVTVTCHENDENDIVIAKAKAQLTRQVGPLPFGYENWDITERRSYE